MPKLAIALLFALSAATAALAEQPLRVGSKTFTESHVLAEISAQLLEANDFDVERRLGLGGTLIAWEALTTGEIELYPEYTGTLTEAVFKGRDVDAAQLEQALAEQGLRVASRPGFNNSYAIAMDRELAARLDITRISDLAAHPKLVFGFSHEFLNRGDGWPALSDHYGLEQQPAGVEHALAYAAVTAGELQATDAYTTDGELDRFDLTLLADDRAFFPRYDAILLVNAGLPARAEDLLAALNGRLDEAAMRALNRRVAIDNLSPREAAAEFLSQQGLVTEAATAAPGLLDRVLRNTATHLRLTGIALLLACLVAIPAALALASRERLARTLLYTTGLLQTIPALALLALFIPVLGLGSAPAIAALFLYSLLPIVRNTLTGLFAIDPVLKDVARGIGLTPRQQLLHIELPLAAPAILAGVKTAAIISIGTATLAAFVGAGGLGEPIITGLSLNDQKLILEGAIPAALLAVTVELLFEWVERGLIPAHLRD
jgi:osmoprotectant transport system permease protein